MGFLKDIFIFIFYIIGVIGIVVAKTSMIGGAIYGAYEIFNFGTELLPAIGMGILFAVIQLIIGVIVTYFFHLLVTIMAHE